MGDKAHTVDGYNYGLNDNGEPIVAIGVTIIENGYSYCENIVMPLV